MRSKFNEAFNVYLQQLSNIHSLDQWSKDLLRLAHMHMAEPYDREKYGWDHSYVYRRIYDKAKGLIDQESPTAFKNILRFHELEYKRYILQTEYPQQKEYIKEVEGEMNLLYEYIKVFMSTIIRSRLDFDNSSNYLNKFSKEDYQKIVKESKYGTGRGKHNYKECYNLLLNARTLKEKIYAVQVTLHTYHDNGKIFGVNSEENDDSFYFAPFTTEQFDQFHVDAEKIEQELKQELNKKKPKPL